MQQNRVLYSIIAGAVVILDQISKWMAREYLSHGGVIRLFDNDLVWLVFVQNPGQAFGLRILPPIALAVFAFLAAVGLGIYLFRNVSIPRWQGIPFALIMGGAIGNMIDRFAFGKVTDFLSVNMPDFIMSRWPVFNVADSAVSVGVTCLLVISIFFKKLVVAEDLSENNLNNDNELT